MDTLYTFGANITHYKTKSVHFWGLMNSATKGVELPQSLAYSETPSPGKVEVSLSWAPGIGVLDLGFGVLGFRFEEQTQGLARFPKPQSLMSSVFSHQQAGRHGKVGEIRSDQPDVAQPRPSRPKQPSCNPETSTGLWSTIL